MNEFQDRPFQDPKPPSNSWKWILLGCLLPLLVGVVCCGGAGLLFFRAVNELNSSETYQEALRRAKADPQVKELLGEPITIGFSTQSNYAESNGVATLQLKAPLTGPKGTATLEVSSGNQTGTWKYTELQVRSSTGEVIDLRTEVEKEAAPIKVE